MKKSKLLLILDKATDIAAQEAIYNGNVIPNKNGVWIGKTLIKKTAAGLYDILGLDNKLIFKDISVFDFAAVLSQRYSSGEFKVVDKVLVLERAFSKHHTDMVHYTHCMQAAKQRHDYDTVSVLEDKYQISEIRAKRARNEISIYKRDKR